MPGKTTGGARQATRPAATDSMHPADLEGLVADLKLKASTPEGRSRLAVLHAVRQAVLERGGAPSCTAYAGALLSSVGQRQDEETTASVVYVLGHVLQHVGPGLLRGKFVPLADVLTSTAKAHAESAPVARHTLQCMYAAIKEQEAVAWRTPQMAALTDLLVASATDPRPKVRKAAQGFLVQLMTEPSPAGEVVRVSLESKIVGMSTTTFKACTSTSTTEAQQLLGMLRDISSGLSAKAMQALSQHVTKLLDNDQKAMAGQVFTTLEAFTRSGEMSEKALARMLATAIQHQPAMTAGMDQVRSYLHLLQTLLAKLHGISADACAQQMPAAFTAVSDYLLPQEKSDEMAVAAANTMCDIIDVCVKDGMLEPGAPGLDAVAAQAAALVEMRYKRNWHCSFAVVQSLLNRLGAKCSPTMDAAVVAMVALHPQMPAVKGASPRAAEELEAALGAAIAAMGPARLLEMVPLLASDSGTAKEELTGEDVTHPDNKLWLLPLLKKHVRGAALGYFVRTLLPLADRIEAAALAADAQELAVEAKNLMHINRQIWGLLPAFMLDAPDLAEALPHVARRLGTCIEAEPDLRNLVCTALLTAIRSQREAGQADCSMDDDEPARLSPQDAQRGLAALAGFAKNFLPILFNAASAVEVDQRPQLLEIIAEYALISEPSRLTALFQNVMKKLLTAAAGGGDDAMVDDDEAETTKILLLDLALALMPALDTSNAEFLYKAAIPFVGDAAGGVQKRAYKLLQLMSQAHTGMMQDKLGHVQEAMVAALCMSRPAPVS